jgi:hypothetical protein
VRSVVLAVKNVYTGLWLDFVAWGSRMGWLVTLGIDADSWSLLAWVRRRDFKWEKVVHQHF